jgi:CubicO group peptidase (beta-lactamase class C family)
MALTLITHHALRDEAAAQEWDTSMNQRSTAARERGQGCPRAWLEQFAARARWLVACVAALALAGGANAAGASTPTSAQVAAATDAFAAAHPAYPGVALAVISPRLHWTGSAGHAALGSPAILDPEAGFRIASVTKTFTAASVLRLVEEGRLGLDDPIAEHLAPATLELLQRGGYDADAIHIRHLLMHTGGLYDFASDPNYVRYVLTHGRHHWTRPEQVRFAMTHGKAYAPPGEEFHDVPSQQFLAGILRLVR